MPELPEVETIRRQLNRSVANKTITRVEIRDKKIIRSSAIGRLKSVKIKEVGRRAKLLLFYLSNHKVLAVHLKMTGKFFWGLKPDKHTRVIFWLGRKPLLFNDSRRFAFMELIDEKKLDNYLNKKFGPEVISSKLNFKEFKAALEKRKKSKIKTLLLDQKFIAGVGNIYAQEACFYAGVKPERRVGALTDTEIKKLLSALKKVVSRAIKLGGTSADDYVNLYGRRGGYARYLRVYGRAGKKCYKCGHKMIGKKINGRGTVWCPECQK